MPTQELTTVQITRRFHAPAESIFDAWLDPERARHFLFLREGQTIESMQIDARVGGTYLVVVRRDGRILNHGGTYLEIERPHRLVFTLRVPEAWDHDSHVTIAIVPDGDACELTITHEGVTAEIGRKVIPGWSAFLENLAGEMSR